MLSEESCVKWTGTGKAKGAILPSMAPLVAVLCCPYPALLVWLSLRGGAAMLPVLRRSSAISARAFPIRGESLRQKALILASEASSFTGCHLPGQAIVHLVQPRRPVRLDHRHGLGNHIEGPLGLHLPELPPHEKRE